MNRNNSKELWKNSREREGGKKKKSNLFGANEIR
jgi:hypothetical protein